MYRLLAAFIMSVLLVAQVYPDGAEAPIKIGDTEAQVRMAIGPPTSRTALSSKTVLGYGEARVTLRGGRVSHFLAAELAAELKRLKETPKPPKKTNAPPRPTHSTKPKRVTKRTARTRVAPTAPSRPTSYYEGKKKYYLWRLPEEMKKANLQLEKARKELAFANTMLKEAEKHDRGEKELADLRGKSWRWTERKVAQECKIKAFTDFQKRLRGTTSKTVKKAVEDYEQFRRNSPVAAGIVPSRPIATKIMQIWKDRVVLLNGSEWVPDVKGSFVIANWSTGDRVTVTVAAHGYFTYNHIMQNITRKNEAACHFVDPEGPQFFMLTDEQRREMEKAREEAKK